MPENPYGRLGQFFEDHRIAGIIGGLGALVGLILGGHQVWQLIHPDKAKSSGVIVTSFQQVPGRSLDLNQTYLLPISTSLPAPEYPAYCANIQEDFDKVGTQVGSYVRFTLTNLNSQGTANVQVNDFSVVVVNKKPSGSGVLIDCVNGGGDAPEFGTVEAENGQVVQSATEGTQGPMSFELSPGENQVVNLQLKPGQEDVEVKVMASLIIDGKQASLAVTPKPIWVHSGSAAGPVSLDIDGVKPKYTCVAKMNSLPVPCPTENFPSLP